MKTSSATTVKTQTQTSTKVGLALLGLAGLAAAAGFVIASEKRPISILHPLLIMTSAPEPTAHSAIMGAQNEPILGIKLQAKNASITVQKLSFAAFFDSDGNFATIENDLSGGDLVTSCVLKNNSTGAVWAGPAPVISNGNILTFSDRFSLPANSVTPFTVSCDLANSSATGKYIMALALIGDPSYVTALGPQGNSLPGSRIYVGNEQDTGVNILHNFVGPTTVTVRDHGKLSADNDYRFSPVGDIIIGNTNNNRVADFSLTAVNETFTVKKLTLKNWGDDAAIKLVSLTYNNQSGIAVTKTGTFSNHFLQFSNLDMYVPTGAANAARIDVGVDTPPVITPYDSGRQLGITMDFTAPGSFQAVAATSGFTVTESSMSNFQPSGTFILRKTRPTITLSSASPSGPARPDAHGYSEILRFNVSAAPTGDVTVTNLRFNIHSTDTTNSGWNSCGPFTTNGRPATVTDLTTGHTFTTELFGMTPDGIHHCGYDNNAVVDTINVNFLDSSLHSEFLVSAGTTHTYSLMLDTAGAKPGDSVSASIPYSPANYSSLDLIWCDAGLQCNANSLNVKTLPLTGGTLVF
ncbi:MAG: hypothetical protein WC802_02280 [Patescibacteria group bacterium]|jgi:hypothetical protein